MYVMFQIHPLYRDSIPYGAEERLANAVREHGDHASSFRVDVGPDARGLRARVELMLDNGLRHRFTVHSGSGARLVEEVEERLRRFLILMPLRQVA